MNRIEDLTPTKGNLLIEPIDPQAPGQLELPESYRDPNPRGYIRCVYEGCTLEVGKIAYIYVSSDRATFLTILLHGQEYLWVDEGDILGTTEPEADPAVN